MKPGKILFMIKSKENGYKNEKSQIVCRVCGTATHAISIIDANWLI